MLLPVLCLFSGLTFADSANDEGEDSPNLRPCNITIDEPNLPEFKGYFEGKHEFEIPTTTARCSDCNANLTANPTLNKLGGGPKHYKGSSTIKWSATCSGGEKSSGGTKELTKNVASDFWVYKLEFFEPSGIKFLDADNSDFIEKNLIAVFTPNGVPHTKSVSGKYPGEQEFSVWTGNVQVNGVQIGSTIRFNVYNSNWLSSLKNNTYVNKPLTKVAENSEKINHLFKNGHTTKYETIWIREDYGDVINSNIFVGAGNATVVEANLLETTLSAGISQDGTLAFDELLNYKLGLTYSISVVTSNNKSVSVTTPSESGVNWRMIITQGSLTGEGKSWEESYYPEKTLTVHENGIPFEITFPEKLETTPVVSKTINKTNIRSYNYQILKQHTRPQQ